MQLEKKLVGRMTDGPRQHLEAGKRRGIQRRSTEWHRKELKGVWGSKPREINVMSLHHMDIFLGPSSYLLTASNSMAPPSLKHCLLSASMTQPSPSFLLSLWVRVPQGLRLRPLFFQALFSPLAISSRPVALTATITLMTHTFFSLQPRPHLWAPGCVSNSLFSIYLL